MNLFYSHAYEDLTENHEVFMSSSLRLNRNIKHSDLNKGR